MVWAAYNVKQPTRCILQVPLTPFVLQVTTVSNFFLQVTPTTLLVLSTSGPIGHLYYIVGVEYILSYRSPLLHCGCLVPNPDSLCVCPVGHPYFVGVQYHPEYLTRPMTPSPPYLGLILASCNKLETFLSRGCQLSPRASYDYEDAFDDEVTQDFTRGVILSDDGEGSSA